MTSRSAYVNMFLPKPLTKMKKLNAQYKLRYEDIVWVKFASNYVLIILRRPKKNLYMPIFSINRATVYILDGLLKGENSQSIIKKLAKNNSLSRKNAMRDFKSILTILKKQNLIY